MELVKADEPWLGDCVRLVCPRPIFTSSPLEYIVKNNGRSRSSIGLLVLALLGCSDTTRAQNTLTATPSQLTLNTQSGVTTQTVSLTSNAPVSVGVTPVSACNWLGVTPGGGTTPLSLTVSVGPSLRAQRCMYNRGYPPKDRV